MGLFSAPSPFDQYVERATSEKNTGEDWSLIMDLCDRIKESPSGAKDGLKSITKRLSNENPRVVLQTITLLDACVNNCGRKFQLEVAGRDFEQEVSKILTSTRTHHKVSEKLRESLKKWAEGEFKGDPELSLVPSLYLKLQASGYDFNISSDSPKKSAKFSTDPNVVSSQQEEDDIVKAIELSLVANGKVDSKGNTSKSSPYSASLSALSGATNLEGEKEPEMKVRAIYDFEAAEDNELTFKSGEIVFVIDHSDPNWWKGRNHRGEGLFPANFVSTDLDAPLEEQEKETSKSQSNKRVSFSECVEVTEVEEDDAVTGQGQAQAQARRVEDITGEIDDAKIDQLLHLIHEADPNGERPDDPTMQMIEAQVNAMAPTIDAELEGIDRKHAQLARVCTELVGSINLYHQLMREIPPPVSYYPAYAVPPNMGPPASLGPGVRPPFMPGNNPPMGPPMQMYPGQYPQYHGPPLPNGPGQPQYMHPNEPQMGPPPTTLPQPENPQEAINSNQPPSFSHGNVMPNYAHPIPSSVGQHGMPPMQMPVSTMGQVPPPQVSMHPMMSIAQQGPNQALPQNPNQAPPQNAPPTMNQGQVHVPSSMPYMQHGMNPIMSPPGQPIHMPPASIAPNGIPFYGQPPPQTLQQPLL